MRHSTGGPVLPAASLLLALALLPLWAGGLAHAAPPPQVDIPETPPFRLPFDGPPGPDTWFVAQWYGNTTLAYRVRETWYEAGQGLHFGLDFGARCGTEVLAIGDGTVIKVDALQHGAGPHNLLIQHENGFVSLYGHLLQRPDAYTGMPVRAGQVVGLSGDPDLTCLSRPHLHLEIRRLDVGMLYNPVLFIDADWDTLALFGPRGSFQQDLADPRRWVTPYDQPSVDLWGPLLNEYAQPWPPGWQQ
ncbi:MAG: hypothetical protein Kow00124_13120 [Anaerolineae bacterium]